MAPVRPYPLCQNSGTLRQLEGHEIELENEPENEPELELELKLELELEREF